MIRKTIAALALAASAAVFLPATAQAATTTYRLTPQERRYACGSFGGTIIFSDNTSLDCSTGIATL
jgi:hypothetical protein